MYAFHMHTAHDCESSMNYDLGQRQYKFINKCISYLTFLYYETLKTYFPSQYLYVRIAIFC